jgi:hypothetical protein
MAGREYGPPNIPAREYTPPNMPAREEQYGVPNPIGGYGSGAPAAAPPRPPQRRGWSVESSVEPRVGTPGSVRDGDGGFACGDSQGFGGVSQGEVDEEVVEEEEREEEGLSVKE